MIAHSVSQSRRFCWSAHRSPARLPRLLVHALVALPAGQASPDSPDVGAGHMVDGREGRCGDAARELGPDGYYLGITELGEVAALPTWVTLWVKRGPVTLTARTPLWMRPRPIRHSASATAASLCFRVSVVVTDRPDKEVLHVAAGRDVASMENAHARRNIAVGYLPCHTMSPNVSARTFQASVAVLVPPSRPEQTRARRDQSREQADTVNERTPHLFATAVSRQQSLHQPPPSREQWSQMRRLHRPQGQV